MWAQLMKLRVRGGSEERFLDLFDELRRAEQPDSGLLRTMGFQDQADASVRYVLVLFESEERARARENDPRRQEALGEIRATMSEVLDGPPEFVDLTLVFDVTPTSG